MAFISCPTFKKTYYLFLRSWQNKFFCLDKCAHILAYVDTFVAWHWWIKKWNCATCFPILFCVVTNHLIEFIALRSLVFILIISSWGFWVQKIRRLSLWMLHLDIITRNQYIAFTDDRFGKNSFHYKHKYTFLFLTYTTKV